MSLYLPQALSSVSKTESNVRPWQRVKSRDLKIGRPQAPRRESKRTPNATGCPLISRRGDGGYISRTGRIRLWQMRASRAVSHRRKPPRYRHNDLRRICHLFGDHLNRNRSPPALNHLVLVRSNLTLPGHRGGVNRGRRYRGQVTLSTMRWSSNEASVNTTLFLSSFPVVFLYV